VLGSQGRSRVFWSCGRGRGRAWRW
jgi:hypothetical protein